jgi:hypothetical protein
VKRPDRFPRESRDQSLMSAHGLRWRRITVKPVRSGLGESLRGGESARQVNRLFESMLCESFGGD